MSVLSEHLWPLDAPETADTHALRAISDQGRNYVLRCVTCDRTLLLPKPTLPEQQPTPVPAGLHDTTACPDHPGQRLPGCGMCRAEQLGVDPSEPRPVVVRGSDPSRVPAWQQAREQFAAGKGAKK